MKDITTSSEYDIRYSENGDIKKLQEWFSYPGVSNNFPFDLSEEKELFIRHWSSFFRHRSALTATYKGKVVGMGCLFLMSYKKVAQHVMLSMIVDPHFQRKGIGTSLIRNLKHLAKTSFHHTGIHFDVYEGSAARLFFEKNGFATLAKQEGFIRDGKQVFKARYLMEGRL